MLNNNAYHKNQQTLNTTHKQATTYEQSNFKKWLIFTALIIGLSIIAISGLWLILNGTTYNIDYSVWKKGLPF